MDNNEFIVKKILDDNHQIIIDYKKSLKEYEKTISALRQQNLMTVEVSKNSAIFDKKIAAINNSLRRKDNPESLKELLLKLPTVIKNIDSTNSRLDDYFLSKLSGSKRDFILDERKRKEEEERNKEIKIVSKPKKDEKKEAEEKKMKKNLVIIVSSIIGTIILIGLLIGYNSYRSEQKAFEFAINNESIENYQSYLNNYPDSDNYKTADIKFQDFLLKNALEENTSEAINTLTNLYPYHSTLKEISFETLRVSYSGELKGVNSNLTTINKIQGKYKIPEGCRVHIFGESPNKRDINKYFTVTKDQNITLNFVEEKQLLIDESFIDNRNDWKFAKDYNDMTVDFNNGFQLYHNNPRNLPFILMNTDLTKIDDFKIELDYTMQRNGNIYLLFAAKESAFSFFGFDERSDNFWVGHNNYNDTDNKWVGWTNNSWRNDSRITNTGKLTIIKKGINIQYYVGDILVNETEYKKYYGDKIGISINNEAIVTLKKLQVYKYTDKPKINFRRNNTYFCSASELKVREYPGLKAKEINRVSQGEAVKYKGGKQNNVKAYYSTKPIFDFFYKVELTDGTIGWVHGGGLNEI